MQRAGMVSAPRRLLQLLYIEDATSSSSTKKDPYHQKNIVAKKSLQNDLSRNTAYLFEFFALLEIKNSRSSEGYWLCDTEMGGSPGCHALLSSPTFVFRTLSVRR